MREMLTSVIIAGLMSAIPAVSTASALSARLAAPDFTKTALGGGTVSLSDFDGQVVVLFLLGYG